MVANTVQFRVRYNEIDRMGTFYNSRALEWFEHGRVELLRAIGSSYAQMEAEGFHLPLIEAHAEYLGRAEFDDLLEMTTTVAMAGKARVRFDMQVVHVAGNRPGRRVVNGYTVHAITDRAGKPLRPPESFVRTVAKASTEGTG